MPKFHEVFNPVLRFISDDQIWKRRDVRVGVADALGLTPEERNQTMSSGANRAENRVGWAIEHLCRAGAIARPTRGLLQIEKLGHKWLSDYPEGIPLSVLQATDGLKEWKRLSEHKDIAKPKGDATNEFEVSSANDSTPEEQIESGVASLRSAVAADLLHRIRKESPKFLEMVVLDVLHAMGYGRGEDDVSHLGGPGDEGVDGVINQDRLGLDQIYVQAKRYKEDSAIGPDVIQSFVGAVLGKGASRGVFITTSRFSQNARNVAKGITQARIILIDGDQLTDLMLEHGVGVTIDKEYRVYKVDENLFED